jgi:hypothetical protein
MNRPAPIFIKHDKDKAAQAEGQWGGTDFSLTKAESGITICLYSAVFS